MLKSNAYVHCTDCRHFAINGEKDFIPCCPYSDKCNLCDCEDGRRMEERPFFSAIRENIN